MRIQRPRRSPKKNARGSGAYSAWIAATASSTSESATSAGTGSPLWFLVTTASEPFSPGRCSGASARSSTSRNWSTGGTTTSLTSIRASPSSVVKAERKTLGTCLSVIGSVTSRAVPSTCTTCQECSTSLSTVNRTQRLLAGVQIRTGAVSPARNVSLSTMISRPPAW